MWTHRWRMVLNMLAPAVLLLDTMGCVTKSDLSKLRQDVASDVRTTTQEVRTLRGKLEKLQTSSKDERTSVTTLEEDLKVLKTKLDVVSDELIAQTATMQKALDRLQAFTNTLVRAYRLQLEGVREHAKDIEQVVKELERYAESSSKNR
jgi:septal ring factor EnvC (AmiA/AmiB activator)